MMQINSFVPQIAKGGLIFRYIDILYCVALTWYSIVWHLYLYNIKVSDEVVECVTHTAIIHPTEDTFSRSYPITTAFLSQYQSSKQTFIC